MLAASACHYCGDILLPREVEHRVPRGRGGTNDRDNLVAACVSCNSDKKVLQVHEWRTLRQAHGLPWPPLASHATDPRHYGDHCSPCRRASGRHWPPHRFVLTPYLLVVSGVRLVGHYACPNGHRWKCSFAPDDGYYSDCPCLFCWHGREDDGAKHWTRPARWDEEAARA